MVEPKWRKKGKSQSSIPTERRKRSQDRKNRNSSRSVGFIDMAAGAKEAEKPENTAFVLVVKWI